MAKCRLGARNLRRIEALTGKKVSWAFVRGGWEHFWADVRYEDGTHEWVNYKTGETEPDSIAHLREKVVPQ